MPLLIPLTDSAFDLRAAWSRLLMIMMALTALLATGPGRLSAQGIKLADDAPLALSPNESRQQFQLPAGFHIELVASEPHLADPVGMAFDPQGRILVCEIHGYNLEGYLDILELNKTGELDTAVRRILANDEAVRQAEQEQYGTVKLLTDTDGDGRIDKSTVLADRLPPCYGVVSALDGVIVLCAPDIIFLADRDNDGRAEVRETLFTGFGVGEMWTRINSPRWGVDNWIYAVSGAGSGGTIRGPHLEQDVELSSVCFRFRPDGSALEAVSGMTHGFGQAIDDWGDRFLCTNQQHALHVIPIEHRYLVRNPYYAAPQLTRNISTYGHPAPVYPTSQPDPWRRARAADPAWVRFYGEAEATASGFFTAASGQTIYQGSQFPAEYYGNHFSVDNAQNLIHRCLLYPNGVSYLVRRPDEQEQTEFLTSTEQWFRPVSLITGPDETLYIVDMYRDIIEDYSAIPRYLQQQYVRSLIAGSERGRIWRIVADNAPTQATSDLSKTKPLELVSYLQHANVWQRKTAQRQLLQSHASAVVPALEDLVRTGETPQSRMHALLTLSGLDAVTVETLNAALHDDHFAIRVHAMRLAESQLDRHPDLLTTMLEMIDHPHPRVRLQLALSLGECGSPDARDALIQLVRKAGDDPWLAAAVLSSTTDTADQVLAAIVQHDDQEHTRGLLHPLASIAGARRQASQVGRILSTLGAHSTQTAVKTACLNGLLEGLQRGRSSAIGTPQAAEGLRVLLTDASPEVRRLAIHVAGQMHMQQAPEMQAIYADAQEAALDEQLSTERRVQAISLLATAPWTDWQDMASELLEPWHPLEIQMAAVEAIGAVETPEAATLLLQNFAAYTPTLRTAVIAAIFSQQDRLPILLDAVEQGTVPRSSLDATRQDQLTGSTHSEIAERAKTLWSRSAATADRQQVLGQYAAALKLPRNIERGKVVFADQCGKCHKLGEEGFEVGPDLLTAKTRADETLLADVLNPSNQITVGYSQYTVFTQAGRIFTGVLAAETATSITLRAEENKETTILRKDIDEMQASTVSMMPENLEKEVSIQDIADLLGFLRQSLGPLPPSSVVLFDDDADFLSVLDEGDGRLRLEHTDHYAGTVSLAVTPPQRFSPQIPEWEYRIRENPEPGEFRYLRFAWKQPQGDGVMLELAASGRWPAAKQSQFRYFSGNNTTEWAAVQTSAERPQEWTLVTLDLWQNCGNFILTGMAPTAMGGEVLFDRIELLRTPENTTADQ